MRIHDSLIGLFFVVLGAYVLFEASRFPGMPGQAIGPGSFPMLFGALFVIGGLIIARQGIAEGFGKLVVLNEGWLVPSRAIAVVVSVFGTILLAAFFSQIGFLIGGVLLLVTLFMLLGHRSLLWVAVAVGFVFGIYFLMSRLLLVPLPAGPLF
ncbi:tripartite tricarboxylate transporter TctB family protein [Pelagibacterium lacus]|uniref:Tripartite tricarboxylate transporter TctB family protein n=1 Tax=Pelagibacterium lacus TaxID=2282655 RepID=A0A369W9W1_9HYPH|nr:tripartite tricarboxylate transporter TctB family protein [Pelagibacterium lacus]RDE10150.1 tripartite tricarboxylate transporter TctB family protein [Pelagibacterium lacus]